MDIEKYLIDAFDAVVHRDFPNPQRIGCPGHESLVKMASSPGSVECGAIIAHVRRCARCFDELKQIRKEHP